MSPAPTSTTSRFLIATRALLHALQEDGHQLMRVDGGNVSGDVVEVFPTIFLAMLLPPRPYAGLRGGHTDELWLRAIGRGGTPIVLALEPYQELISTVDGAPARDRHDLRAAAIAAIAADWFASGRSRSGPDPTMFVGHPDELGFVLPPEGACNRAFIALLDTHWTAATRRLPGLVWGGRGAATGGTGVAGDGSAL